LIAQRECITYRETELIKDLTEKLDLILHVCSAFVPEALLFSLLERNSSRLLERGDTAVADAGVCTSHVFDQMFGANEIPNTPAGGIEGLAGGADSQSTLVQFGGQGSNSCERDIKEAVVDLIGQDDQVVLHAQLANALQLLAREDLADGIVAMKE
jgi:hypothetical protein